MKSYRDKVVVRVNQGIDKIVEEWATEVLSLAKVMSPIKTGKLRESMDKSVDKTSASVGTDVEYGKFVHEGTRKQTANPFLRKAAEIQTRILAQRIKDEFK